MKILPSLVLICVFVSCNKSETSIQRSQIEGKWNITHAFRDGQRTDSVAEGYFSFSSNSLFETNIPGLPNGQNFDFKNGTLQIHGDTCHYQFSNVTDSTANLRVTIRKMPFLFELKKK